MKKYQIIYADPPWQYNFSKSDSRQIENQYPTMTCKDIMLLDIPSGDNSVLYLWATAPKLKEALCVMEAWGFDYKTHAIWDKEIIGMGYWFRGQHELLLVGTKGLFSPPEQTKRIASVIKSRRERHSKKPNVVIDYIDEWYPDATKIEIFARNKRLGWDCWGNEVDSDINLDQLKG